MRTKVLFLASVLVAGCGDDGVDPCPTGNCTLPGNTVVKWKFNNYPASNFDSDTCLELGVANVFVEVIGVDDPGAYFDQTQSCANGQVTFSDLPLQQYAIAVTPLDADGNSLVNVPSRGGVPAAGPGATTDVTVTVQFEQWTRQYTGQFLYKLTWAGASCAAATPVVTQQRLTLTAGGSVTTLVNDRGDKLDGTADYGCWPSTGMPQTVANLPSGPATFLVVGKDATNAEVFRKQFDTFIGAGMFNPTLTFDVEAVPPPI